MSGLPHWTISAKLRVTPKFRHVFSVESIHLLSSLFVRRNKRLCPKRHQDIPLVFDCHCYKTPGYHWLIFRFPVLVKKAIKEMKIFLFLEKTNFPRLNF